MSILRAAFFLLVAFSVFAHGAVEEWARAVFESGAALLFLAWAARCYFRREEHLVLTPLVPPLAALALVALAQCAFRLTASPFHTRAELLLLVADILLVFVAAQLFRTLPDCRAFIWFVMILGFAVAVFGILQHLTFNGKLYWVREMRFGGIPFGPYANRNHFAGFAELVIPASLVPIVFGKVRRERLVLVGLFALITTVALLLSASRGGIISLGVEFAAIAVLLVLRKSRRRHAVAGAVVLLLAVILVYLLGVTQVLQRFSSMQALEVSVGKRASMRYDTWHIFLDHPSLGAGLGALQTVFPSYETGYDGKIVTHSHNDYLEALAETGIAGGLCCLWFLVILVSEGLKNSGSSPPPLESALHAAGLVACAGFLVHSLVDFNLRIPANALLFFLMAHLAVRDIRHVSNTERASDSFRNARNP